MAMAVAGATLCSQAVAADPAKSEAAEIPIYQTVMRSGALRYSVWVKVGDRSIEALLDTGSTGLRVLPAVVPGDLMGMPLEATFAMGNTMRGLAIAKQVEIGSLSGTTPIEVIDGMGCRPDHPACSAAQQNTDSLIGGDGATAHGFSAILGIGFTAPDRDLPNPLELFGAKQWIVDLPRPDEAKPGRIILNPDATTQAQFKLHNKFESGDVFGCLRAKDLEKEICGTVGFDSGGPTLLAVTEGDDPPAAWPPGTDASLKVQGEPPLRFRVGEQGPATNVLVLPYTMRFKKETPYINAGVYPYFLYDVLYDAPAHKVGLKVREPFKPPVFQDTETAGAGETADVPPSVDPAQPKRRRRRTRSAALH
ncbi:hypothetical protein [Beijerinckia sp. L45]|uniref:hypothetical protein n=1 Tax=Beijerinckia sp. L45 TaxID=1641855 RepID=UPI00131B2465|nr:hypothetical protein [Beijerinckia sp. L45]